MKKLFILFMCVTLFFGCNATKNFYAEGGSNSNLIRTYPSPYPDDWADLFLEYDGSEINLLYDRGRAVTGYYLQYKVEGIDVIYEGDYKNYKDGMPTATNAGTYKIYYKLYKSENSQPVDPDLTHYDGVLTVTIRRTSADIQPPTKFEANYQGVEVYYDGFEHDLLSSLGSCYDSNIGHFEFAIGTEGNIPSDSDYSEEMPKATNPGIYRVYYKFVITNENLANNYTIDDIYGETYLDVRYFDVKLDTTSAYIISSRPKVIENESGFIYNGEFQNIIQAGGATNGRLQYKIVPADDDPELINLIKEEYLDYSDRLPIVKDAGNYLIKYRLVDEFGYVVIDESDPFYALTPIAVTVNPALITDVTLPTPSSGLRVNGNNQPLLATSGNANGGEFLFSLTEEGEYTSEIPTGNAKGVYPVFYKLVSTDPRNYRFSDGSTSSEVSTLSVVIGEREHHYVFSTQEVERDAEHNINSYYDVFVCEDEGCDNQIRKFSHSEFNYYGNIQEFTVEKDGVYKIEAWGAAGGSGIGYAPGKGGYISGEVELHEGEKLYITVGGAGSNNNGRTGGAGGYNGGGKGGNGASGYQGAGGGGGATSVATVSTPFVEFTQNEFNQYGLLVAGGGGGSTYNVAGGDTTGGRIASTSVFAKGLNGATKPRYEGRGAEGNGGGGAGYYGGYASSATGKNSDISGYGGSSWANQSLEYVSSQGGMQSGDGKCVITFVDNIKEEETGSDQKTIPPHVYIYNREYTEYDEINNVVHHYKVYQCDSCDDELIEFSYSEFDYSGAVQEFTVEKDGVYKIEAWGAAGGTARYTGGQGGYVSGNVELHAGEKLYITVGGAGSNNNGRTGGAGGYNGGGNGGNGVTNKYNRIGGAGGGGATSIATVNKSLIEFTKEEFDQHGLMVAGGGGGAAHINTKGADYAGGTTATTTNFGIGDVGATKTLDKSCGAEGNGGGGGGYYGGNTFKNSGLNSDSFGYGGTSWVKPTLVRVSTQSGVQSGNGRCVITFCSDN